MKNYFSGSRLVQIKAVLLDLENPSKIVGKIKDALLVPTTDYESKGEVAETIFPSCALIDGGKLSIYYSGVDVSVCLAEVSLNDLYATTQINNVVPVRFEKLKENPILTPNTEHDWESKGACNPAAIRLDNKTYLIYRACASDNISRFGLAVTADGVTIDERLPDPIYGPREDYESKGCEDPRITLLGDRLYICYTAYAGGDDARAAMSSISVDDFLKRNWDKWDKSKLITAPGIYDKDATILPEKVNGKYVIFHRIMPGISVDYSDNLDFGEHNWLKTQSYIVPHPHFWDDEKIGIGPTPIKTDVGWLVIYHGISRKDHAYRVGAMIVDLKDPQLVMSRMENPILEPTEGYEQADRGIVFPCGAVQMGEELYLYYGAADKNVGVAKIKMSDLLTYLVNQTNKKYLLNS